MGVLGLPSPAIMPTGFDISGGLRAGVQLAGPLPLLPGTAWSATGQMHRGADEHADDEGGDKDRYHGRGGLARPDGEHRGWHDPERRAPGEEQ